MKNPLVRMFRAMPRWAVLLFITLISLGPLTWIVLSAFKSNAEILDSALALPSTWSFAGFTEALRLAPIFRFYFNSIEVGVLSTGLNLLVVSMAAYVLARYTFRGRNFITMALASSLLVPVSALIMPIYLVINRLGLYDSKIGLILVHAALGLPTSLFVLRSFFINIPKEIEESAYVDGAGFIRTFFSIVMPTAKSGLATAATLQFLMSWNEFLFALLLTSSTDNRTLPLALNYFTSQFTFNYTAMFAAVLMVVLPSIVVYVALQEQVTESLISGSIKG